MKQLFEKSTNRHHRTPMIIIACAVVFVMVYSLVLPALTIDQKTAEAEPGIEMAGDTSSAEDNVANAGSSGSGSGTGSETPEIGTPQTGKQLTNLEDGTYELSLSITGKGASGGSSSGANVIIVFDGSSSMVIIGSEIPGFVNKTAKNFGFHKYPSG